MPTFDAFAEGYGFWIERVNPPHYDRLLGEFLVEPSGYALDVGCGPGFLTRYLAACGMRAVGIDLSPAMIAESRKRLGERMQNTRTQNTRTQDARNQGALKGELHFLVADLYHLPFLPGTFDFIGSDCVLHDLPVDEALPRLVRMLKPGGRLVIRDLVTDKPAQSTIPAWQVLRTCKQVPRYLRQFGPADTLRVLSFELSPGWVRHKCAGANITPQEFRHTYSRLLPGSTFLDFGWAVAACWVAPLGVEAGRATSDRRDFIPPYIKIP